MKCARTICTIDAGESKYCSVWCAEAARMENSAWGRDVAKRHEEAKQRKEEQEEKEKTTLQEKITELYAHLHAVRQNLQKIPGGEARRFHEYMEKGIEITLKEHEARLKELEGTE